MSLAYCVTMEGFSTVSINMAYILYEINTKNDYKRHTATKTLSAAKAIKKAMKSVLQLPGDSVFVNKLVGFHVGDHIHCTNGYKYSIAELNRIEQLCVSADANELITIVMA